MLPEDLTHSSRLSVLSLTGSGLIVGTGQNRGTGRGGAGETHTGRKSLAEQEKQAFGMWS